MGSTFSCYGIAVSGLYSSQTGLNVTSHNISNVNTTGYVRQQATYVEKLQMKYGQNQVGTGVSVSKVRQLRSIFLDNIYRKENSSLGYWNKKSKTIEDVESVMDALSEDGIGSTIDQFFTGWEELAKDPETLSARESLVEYGNSLVDILNQFDEQLNQIQDNLDSQIYSMVNEINEISNEIADINQKILINEISGNDANDYRDQANSLIDTLSGLVNIKASEDESGMIKVTLGGVVLVNGKDYLELSCGTNVSNGAFGTVYWKDSGMEVKLKDGELLGLIEARGNVNGDKGSTENGSPVESGIEESDVDNDSQTYNFTGEGDNFISELKKGLNMLVSLLVRKINAIHREGVGLDGSTGIDFFVKIDENLPYEAGNIKLNPLIEEDTNKIAASGTGESGNGDTANLIVDFKSKEYFKSEGLEMNIDDFYSLIVNWIGTMGEEAESSQTNQSTLVLQTENQKLSLSAVSLDEEMSNIIKLQHAYNASSQVLNMIDSMMDKLINSTGTVGR